MPPLSGSFAFVRYAKMTMLRSVLEIKIRNLSCLQISSLVAIVSYELWINGSFYSVESLTVFGPSDNDDDGGGIPLAA